MLKYQKLVSNMLINCSRLAKLPHYCLSTTPTKEDLSKTPNYKVLFVHSSFTTGKILKNRFLPLPAIVVFICNMFTSWNALNSFLFAGFLAYSVVDYVKQKNVLNTVVYCVQTDKDFKNLYLTVPLSLYSFSL